MSENVSAALCPSRLVSMSGVMTCVTPYTTAATVSATPTGTAARHRTGLPADARLRLVGHRQRL
jgi:hypothetical protein